MRRRYMLVRTRPASPRAGCEGAHRLHPGRDLRQRELDDPRAHIPAQTAAWAKEAAVCCQVRN